MKLRRLIIALAIVAGLVFMLVLGRWVTAWRAPLALIEQGGQAIPTTLQFVPKQSPLVVSVLARPDRLADLWLHLARSKQRSALKKELAWLEQVLLAPTGLAYQQDLQPWVGEEITAAVVSADIDQDPNNGLTPGYLVIFTCRQSQTALASLELFWQNQALGGAALTFSDRVGSRLISSSQSGLATTLVGDRFLLVANHPEVLRQALVAAQATDTNLQFDRRYQTALQALPSQRVGLVAMNLPGLKAWQQGLSYPDGPVNLGAPDRPEVDWGLLSLALTRRGIVADLALAATPGKALEPRQGQVDPDLQLVRYLPDALAIAGVGRDLGILTQTLRPLLSFVPPDWRSGLSVLQAVDRGFGQGTMARVEAGLDQNYALGITFPSGQAQPDWSLISQPSPGWHQTLEELEHLAQTQGLGVSSLEIQHTPVRAWSRLAAEPGGTGLALRAEVAGLEADLEGYQVLTASAEGMNQLLGRWSAPGDSPAWLTEAESWKSPAAAYLQVDWPQLQAQLQAQAPPFRLWEVAARPLLHHLQKLTLVSYGQSDRLQTSRIFFHLTNP